MAGVFLRILYMSMLNIILFSDINECKELHSLCINGMCINNQGSFRCQCPQYLSLAKDGRTCVGRYIYKIYMKNVLWKLLQIF